MILEFLDVSMWVFIVGLVVGAIYLVYVQKQRVWLRIAYLVLVLTISLAGWYLLAPPTPAQVLEPQRFSFFLLLILGVPLAVFAIGLPLIARLKASVLRHVVLAAWALPIALVWPLSALYLHCAVGLGCF
jgi:hypothetical protein